MLDLKLIRNQPLDIAENCRKRDVEVDIEKLLELDELVRKKTSEIDSLRNRRNEISKKMKSEISNVERQPLIEESKKLREIETDEELMLRKLIDQRLDLHKKVPNLTHPDSPKGFNKKYMLHLR